MISRFVANSEKCCKYTFLGGSAQIITILHRGGYQNLLQYYMGGGLPNLLQYYNGGGGLSGPKFVLHNIWTAPYYYQSKYCLFPIFILISIIEEPFHLFQSQNENT